MATVHIELGQPVQVREEQGCIVIEPVRRKKYKLDGPAAWNHRQKPAQTLRHRYSRRQGSLVMACAAGKAILYGDNISNSMRRSIPSPQSLYLVPLSSVLSPDFPSHETNP